ncbi:MAG: hypothetical protein HUU11_18990 [Anaerolineales bacterium]|nr:hypothetical protein [Anaerolineales bacterium]
MTDYFEIPLVFTGDWIDAAWINQYLRDNFRAFKQGLANAGDMPYALDSNTIAALSKPSVDSVLMNTSAGVPSYKALTDFLAVVKRQGGHADDWSSPGTTTYTPTLAKIQGGAITVTMTGSPAYGTLAVTFPVAFSGAPIVQLTAKDTGGGQDRQPLLAYASLTASGFTIVAYYNANSASYGNVVVHWVAFGL